jgi:hypothetical protein
MSKNTILSSHAIQKNSVAFVTKFGHTKAALTAKFTKFVK